MSGTSHIRTALVVSHRMQNTAILTPSAQSSLCSEMTMLPIRIDDYNLANMAVPPHL